MFWDGRADALQQQQAFGPLLNPVEMANASVDDVARKLKQSSHRAQLEQLFGPRVSTARSSRCRRRCSRSRAIRWKIRRSIRTTAIRPLARRPCAPHAGRTARAAPVQRSGQGELRGLPPVETRQGRAAADVHRLPVRGAGAPRNKELAQNRNPAFYDLGVCGPFRRRPEGPDAVLRDVPDADVAQRGDAPVFFHNGVFHTLDQVMAFYNERSISPRKFYSRAARTARSTSTTTSRRSIARTST